MFRKFSQAANGLVIKIARALVLKHIEKAAKGEYGPTPRAIYWKLAGGKRLTAAALLAIAGGTAALGGSPELAALVGSTPAVLQQIVMWVGLAGAFLLSAGLLDAEWRTEAAPPWADAPWWRWLADHASINTLAFGLAWWYVESACVGEWCASARVILGLLGAVAMHFGLIDAAVKATPPQMTLQEAVEIAQPAPPKDGK